MDPPLGTKAYLSAVLSVDRIAAETSKGTSKLAKRVHMIKRWVLSLCGPFLYSGFALL